MNSIQAKAPYHHGNLKVTLLEQAVNIINDEGINALTIRKVASKASVSHTACYRHFSNKDDLIDAIATQGFELFLMALQDNNTLSATAMDNFIMSGKSYIQFAYNYPAHYELMFTYFSKTNARETLTQSDELKTAGEAAFNHFFDHIKACQDEGAIRQGHARNIALFVWASCHGFCSLNLLQRTEESIIEDFIALFQQQIFLGLAP